MNFSLSFRTSAKSYSNDNQDLSKCWWCEPVKISEGAETFFSRPKALENPIPRPAPISTNAGEKLKRCDFDYLPGILFGKKILVH